LLALAALFAVRSPAVAQAVQTLLVRNVDTPALQPFTQTFRQQWAGLQLGDPVILTVPPGRRLVLEAANLRSTTGAFANLDLFWQRDSQTHFLSLRPHEQDFVNTVLFWPVSYHRPIKAYLDPDTRLGLSANNLTLSFRPTILELTLTGHWVNLPE
jgi:hypothetical protein